MTYFYRHKESNEIHDRYEWLRLYSSHRRLNEQAQWFGYEARRNEYPRTVGGILSVLEPVELESEEEEIAIKQLLRLNKLRINK